MHLPVPYGSLLGAIGVAILAEVRAGVVFANVLADDAAAELTLALVLVLIGILMMTSGCGKKEAKDQASQQTAADQQKTESAVPETSIQTDTATASDAVLTITALKAGAADAFVLMSGDHVTIIDTGLEKKADKLTDFLKEQGITKVDELIITHFDKDHVGGADHVINDFEVGKVYTTYQSKDSDDIDAYRAAMEAKGLSEIVVNEVTTFSAGDISFTIYPPEAGLYRKKTSNNSSLVIRVSLGENSMLFAGDAEQERIKELLYTEGLKSTILKVPHHGRLAINSEAFIDYVSPEYAIITSSKSEPEDQEIMDILARRGIKTYLTRDGNITVIMTEDELTVTQ